MEKPVIAPRIRRLEPRDDADVVHMQNRMNPLFPPNTVQNFRSHIDAEPDDLLAERWVADLDSTIVGTAELFEERSATPGIFYGNVGVDVNRRNAGIGRQLYDFLVQRAVTAGAVRLYGLIAEDQAPALAFATRRGFNPTGKGERLSRLDVSAAKLEGFEGIEERLLAAGIRIATLEELGPDDDDFMHRLYEVDRETHADIPSSEEHGFDAYDVWLRLYVLGHGRSPRWCWVAMDGDRPVGLSRLKLSPGDAAWHAYTGVDRAYRGRGIARALKLRNILWSRANGVRYLYTGNEAESKRMLAINMSMGYEMLPRDIEIVKGMGQCLGSASPYQPHGMISS